MRQQNVSRSYPEIFLIRLSKITKSEKSVPRARFEPISSRINVTSFSSRANLLGLTFGCLCSDKHLHLPSLAYMLWSPKDGSPTSSVHTLAASIRNFSSQSLFHCYFLFPYYIHLYLSLAPCKYAQKINRHEKLERKKQIIFYFNSVQRSIKCKNSHGTCGEQELAPRAQSRERKRKVCSMQK